MTDFCAQCNQQQEEIAKLKRENSAMRSVINLVTRAVSEVEVETLLESDSLSLDNAERLLVLEALSRTDGNRTLAAQLLGCSRSAFFCKMQRHGIKDKKTRIQKKQKPYKIEGLNTC